MKKLWALALATALSVACIGCGNQTESKKNTRESIDVQTDSDATQADTSEPVVVSMLWRSIIGRLSLNLFNGRKL